jgi:hypothetical protein
MMDRIRKKRTLPFSFNSRKMTLYKRVRVKTERRRRIGRSKRLPRRMPEIKRSKT